MSSEEGGKIITQSKLKKYFEITGEALEIAKKAISNKKGQEEKRQREEILDMASRYYEDAKWFAEKGDLVNAFAALNYAHGWLDAGARLGLFKVKDSKLFVVK